MLGEAWRALNDLHTFLLVVAERVVDRLDEIDHIATFGPFFFARRPRPMRWRICTSTFPAPAITISPIDGTSTPTELEANAVPVSRAEGYTPVRTR